MLHKNAKVVGLSNALKAVQELAVGVFKPKFGSDYELVISDDDSVLETLSVGGLLGLNTLHIGADQGHYVPFLVVRKGMLPGNSTYMKLSEMMQHPLEFAAWYKYFVTERHDVYNEVHPENCKFPSID